MMQRLAWGSDYKDKTHHVRKGVLYEAAVHKDFTVRNEKMWIHSSFSPFPQVRNVLWKITCSIQGRPLPSPLSFPGYTFIDLSRVVWSHGGTRPNQGGNELQSLQKYFVTGYYIALTMILIKQWLVVNDYICYKSIILNS